MRPTVFINLSPNFNKIENRKISCIVLHATATPTIRSPLNWLCSPKSRVSAHYLIDMNGSIYQLVEEKDVAWHAGVSEWRGNKYVNNFSIGIELVNANDGKQEYPQVQVASCAGLCADICKDYKICLADVVGHADIAPGRKNDPLGFPWDTFRVMLKSGGIT